MKTRFLIILIAATIVGLGVELARQALAADRMLEVAILVPFVIIAGLIWVGEIVYGYREIMRKDRE